MPDTRKRAREKHPGSKEELKEETIVKEPEDALIKEIDKEASEAGEGKIPEEGVVRGITISEQNWKPKTEFGRLVFSDKITNIDQILSSSKPILEPEIVDKLLPGMETVLLNIWQSKGKFGGGKRSIWRQTQKKTKEGNKPKFAAYVVIGNRNGYVGLGRGKSKETMPAREKALRQAKLNIIKIIRGCGSWEGSPAPNSIPFAVEGKCGSVRIKLMPAPNGTGLCVENECKKMLALAGIKDIYSKTFGQTKVKINLLGACFEALKNLSLVKINQDQMKKLGYLEGSLSDGNAEDSSN